MGFGILENWLIQSAGLCTIMLTLGVIAMYFTQHPAHRICIIQWTLAACLVVPAIAHFDVLPQLTIPVQTSAPNTSMVVAESVPISRIDASPARVVPTAKTIAPPAAEPGLLMSRQAKMRHDESPAAIALMSWNASAASIASVCYSAIVLMFVLLWIVGRVARWLIVRNACPADRTLQDCLQDIAGQSFKTIRLLTSDRIESPLMWGVWRPTIVVPRQLTLATAANQLRYGLAHEWSHVARGDFLVHSLAVAAKLVCFYQPLYWWMRRQLMLSQDLLADAFAARHASSAEDYAAFLVTLARGRSAPRFVSALAMTPGRSHLARRVRALVADQTFSGRTSRRVTWSIAIVASLLALSLSSLSVGAVPLEEEKQNQQANDNLPEPITYTGIVVDRNTGRPIAGATVAITRELSRDPVTGGWIPIETTEHLSDEHGKYSFTLPPEQVAQPSLYIVAEAFHPNYQSTGRVGYAHSMILKNISLGNPPFFERLEMSPGVPVQLTVRNPDGTPAPGVRVGGYTRATSSRPKFDFSLGAFLEAETNENGEVELVIATPGDGVIWVFPKDFAAAAIRIGDRRGKLDDVTLTPGVRLSGQVLSAGGEPVANVAVNVRRDEVTDPADEFVRANSVINGIRSGAITNDEGRFMLHPLPPGTYLAEVENRVVDPTVEFDRRLPELKVNDVFVPQQITIAAGEEPQPIEIRAVPHVVIRGRFLNSQGAPRSGHQQHFFARDNGVFVSIWSTRPGDDGWFEFKVPHGVDDAKIMTMTNEHSPLRWRTEPGEPLKYGDEISLGKLEGDLTTLEIVRYSAPILFVRAIDEDGSPVDQFVPDTTYTQPSADPSRGRFTEGGDVGFERLSDGRWQSSQLLPDAEITVKIDKNGYTTEPQMVTLPEGETRELVFTLRKQAK